MTVPTWVPSKELKRKMMTRIFVIILIFLFFVLKCFSQTNTLETSILFYNVENLFDTKRNPKANDEEFTPNGDRHWTNYRLNKKLQNISKVILSSSGWNPPAVVGLCEVENRTVLEKLVSFTPLKSISYKIIHKESPDHRGIDVALLYNPKQFYPLEYIYYPLVLENDSIMNTREMLYVSGVLNEVDTIHIFVNHWPSRYSGLMETRQLRNLAAKKLRSEVDKLFREDPNSKIIIVGDFNDQPNDQSLSEYLKAKIPTVPFINSELFNLSFDWLNNDYGTLKYQSQWSVFDQIIVSGSLLNQSNNNEFKVRSASIVNLPFLFENDEKYGGKKPKRTYTGFSYDGGFSDHLPVILKLDSKN